MVQIQSNQASVGSINVLGGLIFGYCTVGIIGTANPDILQYFYYPDTGVYQSILASSVVVGAIIGSYLGGFCSNRLGRKMTVYIGTLLAAYGHCSALASNFWILNVLRLFIGIGSGTLSVVCPLYVSEMASEERKGMLGTLFQLAITLGIFIATFVGYLCHTHMDIEISWRVSLGLGAVFPVILFVMCYFIMEEPNPNNRALGEPLKSTSNFHDAPEERRGGWGALFVHHSRAVITSLILCCTLQLTGINAIMLYGPNILKDAGLQPEFAVNMGVGGWNFVTTLIAVFLVDRLGRRVLILIGTALMAVAMLESGIINEVYTSGTPLAVGVGLGLALFIAGFEMGIGCLFWVFNNEIFPIEVRETGGSFANIVNNIFTLMISFCFPLAKDAIGMRTFFIFGGVGVLCFIYLVFFLKETKKPKQDFDDLVN